MNMNTTQANPKRTDEASVLAPLVVAMINALEYGADHNGSDGDEVKQYRETIALLWTIRDLNTDEAQAILVDAFQQLSIWE
jgi:hypothetical protein